MEKLLPYLIAIVLATTAVYNLFRDAHVKAEMKQRSIPVWLRFPAVIVELSVGILVLLGHSVWAMLVAAGLLSGSILVCLLTKWYRRLWLSVPLLFCTIAWFVSGY